jgi:hypothetical protein
LKIKVFFISSILFLTGCSSEFPNDSESQWDYACGIVTGWPADYATVWPTAVRKHNESPDQVSAAEYMQDYVTTMSLAFKISDPAPSLMISQYKEYWSLLEQDFIFGGGSLPANPVSSSQVVELMKQCDSLGRGFKQE